MNSLKNMSLTVVGAIMIGLVMGLSPAEAASIFTDEATFLSNVQSGSYLEKFDSLEPTSPGPLPFSQNGFIYSATAINSSPRNSGFFNEGRSSDVWLSTFTATTPIVFNFTSGNISAVGGAFFPSQFSGELISGRVTLALSDGTTQTLTDTNSSSFLGLIADPGSFFTSLMVTAVQPPPGAGFIWPTVNNLRVGTATPVPTPALLPGLIGLGLGMLRKRQIAAAEADG
jgi:hypothetical protein